MHPDELVHEELEARLADEPPIRVGVEAREEHLDPEPLVGAVLTSDVAHRREEQAAGLQPAHDPAEQIGLSSRGTCTIE